MLAFLESSLALDASGLNFNGSASIVIPLPMDARSTPAIATYTVAVPLNPDTTIPYTATLVKVSNQLCTLTILFDQPTPNIHFNELRTLIITANNAESTTLDIEINHADPFSTANWSNSADGTTTTNVVTGAPLGSLSLNGILRGLLRNANTALRKALETVKYYGFRRKYLPDIIDFAIMSGCSQLPGTAVITYDGNGNPTSAVTTYTSSERGTSLDIKITYTYATFDLFRYTYIDGIYTQVTTESISLLDTVRVDALDSSKTNVIYNIGTVQINRTQSYVNIPFLPDYNSGLPPGELSTNPGNIMSAYKYYRAYVVTGWTVVV